LLRTLANYADHPNVGGVVLLDLGCEKTNLSFVEKYLLGNHRTFDKPVAKIGIQEEGGTMAAIDRGLREVERMLPEVNQTAREEIPASELVLGVKCGGSDGFSGISANPALGRAAEHPRAKRRDRSHYGGARVLRRGSNPRAARAATPRR
jgi:altronate hydrolase